MDSTAILGCGYTCGECGQWNRTSALCNHFNLIPSIKMDRQEGYYWVKYKKGPFAIGYWNLEYKFWSTLGNDDSCEDTDFEHINEVRIKQPGEIPD